MLGSLGEKVVIRFAWLELLGNIFVPNVGVGWVVWGWDLNPNMGWD